MYISINARPVADVARGFDVMDGRKVVAHFAALGEAREFARRKARYCVRYWGEKKKTE